MNCGFVNDSLRSRIEALFADIGPRAERGFGDLTVGWGLEDLRRGDPYYFDGLRRHHLKDRRIVVFQHTLDGWGAHRAHGKTRRVRPGHAFVAVTPGPYVYWLPREAPRWTFFWLSIHHRTVSSRVVESQERAPHVFAVPGDSPLMTASLDLLHGIFQDTFEDEFAREEALLRWMFAYLRGMDRLMHPRDARHELLEEVRAAVLGRLGRPLSVKDLASARGMSRTHYSHDFRRITGQTPAAFATRVRIREAERRLRQTHDTIETLAKACGFTAAAQMIRVFRRHYHTTPDAWRRQSARVARPT